MRGGGHSARLLVVTPAPARSLLGNRVTAVRWQRMLRELGCRVRVAEAWTGEAYDAVIALHATKSAASIRGFAERFPERPVVVALTGTDLYRDLGRDARTRASIERARLLVVLQPEALQPLGTGARAKARVVLQSAVAARGWRRRARGAGLRVIALAHLRAVKNPLLAARAARLLPAGSRIAIEHYGAASDRRLAARARAESRANPRWSFRGARAHAVARRLLAEADLFLQTSDAEGGAAAMAEALVAGVPIVATRTAGAVGMLGRDHPGLTPPGDAAALARLLARCEVEPGLLRELAARSRARAPLHAPERERAAWAAILAELGLGRDRPSGGGGRRA